MTQQSEHDAEIEEIWRTYLTKGEYTKDRRRRRFFRFLPGDPRCKNCYAPFQGAGGAIVNFLYGKRPSNMNPRLCNACEVFASKHRGGAEVELSLLFGDVRGSTSLAERMSPKQFSRLINRFYNSASQVLVRSDALIDKIIGDQVAGIYVPGLAGAQHARRAIEAAQELLHVTGHHSADGPWIPLGIGIHTGIAFVGSVSSEAGTMDITVLGDVANAAARLSTVAGPGEILISEAAQAAAGLEVGNMEKRSLALKGKSDSMSVYVLTSDAPAVSEAG